ncbi:MAG: Cache 3/Cache 2 fusion domain-containing protein [Rhodocyclales bacterium]|nr:Cache 3/Cache 2 fusion domain-containing protein [Rhodocyclales bacterium]
MLGHSLQVRFIAPVSVSILLIVLGGAVVFSSIENARIERELAVGVDERIVGIKQTLGVTDAIVMDQTRAAMRLLKERGMSIGTVSLGVPVTVKDKTVPNLLLGGRPQANNFELVDGVTKLLGGTATLFVKSGDEFVRISTNVKRDNERATGTILDPKGKAIAAIREDKPFYGVVDILGNPFLTGYEPMHDAQGRVIGIWYVGYKADMAAIKQTIEGTRLLTSGFLAIVDGNDKVRYRSSHVEDARVTALLKDDAGWIVKREDYPGWGFRIVAAYPLDEASRIGRDRMLAIIAFGVVASLALIGVMYVMLRRLVLAPLGGEPTAAAEAARHIAAGDLTGAIAVAENDRDSVMAAMEQMRTGLTDIVRHIQDGVVALDGASVRLSETASQVSDGVARQNDATASIAATLEEITVSMRHVSDSAEGANRKAMQAGEMSSSGNAMVGEAVANMKLSAETVNRSVASVERLAGESQRISAIVDVIKEIADQTNLLALNAAIEAARAGETGRGFAVVADEVRKLAERTSVSTQEISSMVDGIRTSSGGAISDIEDGAQRVNSSVAKAVEAGQSMAQVHESTADVVGTFGEISAALREQSSASEVIARNVEQVSEMNEMNAAAMQHVVEYADQLKALSEKLRATVGSFRV